MSFIFTHSWTYISIIFWKKCGCCDPVAGKGPCAQRGSDQGLHSGLLWREQLQVAARGHRWEPPGRVERPGNMICMHYQWKCNKPKHFTRFPRLLALTAQRHKHWRLTCLGALVNQNSLKATSKSGEQHGASYCVRFNYSDLQGSCFDSFWHLPAMRVISYTSRNKPHEHHSTCEVCEQQYILVRFVGQLKQPAFLLVKTSMPLPMQVATTIFASSTHTTEQHSCIWHLHVVSKYLKNGMAWNYCILLPC